MKQVVMIIVLLIFSIVCQAKQYNLEELINIGLEKSYDIQKESANEQNSRSLLRGSIYGVLPNLTLQFERSKSYDPIETDWASSASLSLTKSFSLNEPSYFNIRTSIYNRKNAELSLDEMRKQIAYSIFSRYLSVLELQETVEIQQKNLELQNKIHLQIQVQFDAGDKSLLELKQSEISLIDYEIALNEASNSLKSTRQDLFSFLNIKDEEYEFATPEFELDLSEKEFATNNLLEQKSNLLKNSKLLHSQTSLNILPTFSIGYSLGHLKQDDVLNFPDYNRSNNTLYLSASWDVFGFLSRSESYSRSKRNLKIQNLEYETSRQDYDIQLANLQDDLKTLQKSFELYEEKLVLATDNLNMAQEQFRLGMISLLDLDRSKIEYQNTQLARLQKRYQLMKKQEEINLLLSHKILGKW